MLSDAELREMERLIGVRSGLPKQHARKLLDAYRELASRHIVLSESDSAAFVDALLNPPAPNGNLQTAANRQNRRKKNETLDTETEN